MERCHNMHRSKKKKAKLDDVDIFVKNKKLHSESESMSSFNKNTDRIIDYSY